MLRQAKTTPDENARQTLLVGFGGFVAILLMLDPLLALYDLHLRQKPWLSAQIEIVSAGETPVIKYGVEADLILSGTWKAWVESPPGKRGCGGGGRGDYSPRTSEPKLWKWDAFFEADCAVPEDPFRVCTRYTVETPRGAKGDFGPFCSQIHRGEEQ